MGIAFSEGVPGGPTQNNAENFFIYFQKSGNSGIVEAMSVVHGLISQGILRTPRIIEAFRAVRREDFVLPELRHDAEVNAPLPIGYGQTISPPLTVAIMLELLDPQPGQKILDIGAGSGWQAALLAYIVSRKSEIQSTKSNPFDKLRVVPSESRDKIQNPSAHSGSRAVPRDKGKVYAVERVPELCEFGKANVAKYNFIKKGAVEWICGDASQGLSEHAPYDRIIAAAAAGKLPDAWREQCAEGGIMVAPVQGSVWRLQRKQDGSWDEKEYPGFAFVPLIE